MVRVQRLEGAPRSAEATLRSTTVQVWMLRLDGAAAPGAGDVLSADERDRAARFRFDVHRRRFIAVRSALRRLLGERLDLDPRAVRFGAGPFGKPFCDGPTARHVRFNVSHSDDRAVIAIADDVEIGVDIERIQPLAAMEPLAATVFSPRERAELEALPGALRLEAFFCGWARKEAYIKARGEGLQCPLQDFDVSLDPRMPPSLIAARHDPDAATRWSWSALVLPEYAGALCVEGGAHEVVYHEEWTPEPAHMRH